VQLTKEVASDITGKTALDMVASFNANSARVQKEVYTLHKCQTDALKGRAAGEAILKGFVPWPSQEELSDGALAESMERLQEPG